MPIVVGVAAEVPVRRCRLALRLLMQIVTATVIGSGGAAAQESGQVGITMSYPSRLGLLWHVTERVALLPDVAFQRIVSGSVIGIWAVGGPETTTRTSTTTWEISPGINALIHLVAWDDVTTYVTAGWSHVRTSATRTDITTTTGASVGLPPSGTERQEFTWEGYETRGALGVRYVPRRHFGVFGEVGIEYSKTDFDDLTGSSFRNRGVAGAVFYF